MRQKIKISSLIVSVLTACALLIGVDSSQVNAIVSTYRDVSPRISGYDAQAVIESPHSVSGDGRYVVFSTYASNIISGDTNGANDVFLRDTQNNTTTRVSVSSAGTESNSNSGTASISNSGRYIVFSSMASNLTTGITGTSRYHVYMHDMVTNITSLVDTSSSGVVGDGDADYPQVSADGRFVVFQATGTNLVSGINSASTNQIYIKDMHSGAIKALSVTSAGVKGHDGSSGPDISCDGNVVAFSSAATNLGVPTGQPGRQDLIVINLGWNGDELNDVTSGTTYGIMGSSSQISCDGNIALFTSTSTDVVSPSTPSGYVNAYQYNRITGAFTQASLGNGNTQSNASSSNRTVYASMSGDGRYVAFVSGATNADATYPNGSDSGSDSSIYIRDVKKSTTEMVTVLPSGNRSRWAKDNVSMSANGSVVVFPYNVPTISNSSRSLISGYNSGSTTQSYKNIFSAEMNY